MRTKNEAKTLKLVSITNGHSDRRSVKPGDVNVVAVSAKKNRRIEWECEGRQEGNQGIKAHKRISDFLGKIERAEATKCEGSAPPGERTAPPFGLYVLYGPARTAQDEWQTSS